jgi:carbon monoxide dehydrogenase subunit G
MRLSITKSVELPVAIDAVWSVIRDPETVAAQLPNLRDFRPAEGRGTYETTLVERLGPFAVQVPLRIEVSEATAEHRMTATVAGDDRGGAARVRGEVRATATEGAGGASASVLEVAGDVEVLGRLATLGAVPMRRRADQVFDQFVRNLATLLEGGHG